jgi:hypothetical protein
LEYYDLITSVSEAYLVTLIASFSGRELSASREYLDTRERSLSYTLSRASGIAIDHLWGSVTGDLDYTAKHLYAVGRAAEAYYFDHERIAESEFIDEADEVL